MRQINTIENQSILDVVLQEYGTIDDLFLLVKSNRQFFKDSITRYIPSGSILNISNDSSAVKIHGYYQKRVIKIATAMSYKSNQFILIDYSLTNTIAPGNTASLEITIQCIGDNIQPGYLFIGWGFGDTIQTFLLENNSTKTIVSTQIVPFGISGEYIVTIYGAISMQLPLTVKGWILEDGTWNDAGYWMDNRTWKD